MKNQKGFTLIELLAVIVILAVIALIATPLIMNVIDKAKKGAAENSAYGYINAIESKLALDMIDGSDVNLTDNNFTNANIPVKGDKPDTVALTIENGIVKSGTIYFGKYAVQIVDGEVQK